MWKLSNPNEPIATFLDRLQRRYGRYDSACIITGFLGSGSRERLERLGVRRAKVILGSDRPSRTVPRALVCEIKQLEKNKFAEVRVCPGLHAKLYILDNRLLLLGSANLSQPGFDTLREVMIATDAKPLILEAEGFFNAVWADKRTATPNFRPSTAGRNASRSLDPAGSTLGVYFKSKTQARNKQMTKRGSTSKTDHPIQTGDRRRTIRPFPEMVKARLRIVANSADQLVHPHSFAGTRKKITWSAIPSTRPGDVFAFCVSRTRNSARDLGRHEQWVDSVHSLWRAESRSTRSRGNAAWPYQAEFGLLIRLNRPVPRHRLVRAEILKSSWPQGWTGRLLETTEDITRFAEALAQDNRSQHEKLLKCLGLHESSKQRVRIVAYEAYQADKYAWGFDRNKRQREVLIPWGSSPGGRPGDLQLFCISRDLREMDAGFTRDPRFDAVVSIWQLLTEPKRTKQRGVHQPQAKYKRLLRLDRPVKRDDMINEGVLNGSRWPRGKGGKLLVTSADKARLAEVLAKRNHSQAREIRQILVTS